MKNFVITKYVVKDKGNLIITLYKLLVNINDSVD
jgi:hypothetical protein